MQKLGLGIIDAQRGFMPKEEGMRLGVPGFGELTVPCGEMIVPYVNKLLAAFVERGYPIFTTQDWHPNKTAHFDTWGRHCVGGTPGAELHPEIIVPKSAQRFKKGMESLTEGVEDTSYSGYYAVSDNNESLGDWLKSKGVERVVLGGLALNICVKETAFDLQNELGLDVTIASDAVRGIGKSIARTTEEFIESGMKVMATDEIIAKLPPFRKGV